jgi:hypothetical protein
MDKTRMRKTLAILFVVLFLLTVTVSAVSASSNYPAGTIDPKKPIIIAIGHNVAGDTVAKDKNPLLYVANKDSDDTSQGTFMATMDFIIHKNNEVTFR